MEALYLWPDKPLLSIFVLWLGSVVLLWAARDPMLEVVRAIGEGIQGALRLLSRWCKSSAEELHRRGREALLASAQRELRQKMERELHRVDVSFSRDLSQYARLHRKLDDLLMKLDADYQSCVDSPPAAPGWETMVKAVRQLPVAQSPGADKVLDGLRRSVELGEKKVLQEYRDSTRKRHRLLNGMLPYWKEIKALMTQMKTSVGKALETTVKIDGYVSDYQEIARNEDQASRALTYSATKLFITSLVVLAVAVGGAFINFQLIALPMSELVPAGARLGGLPMSHVAALVIVLMEAAAGIFILDGLGITELFPKFATLSPSRRRVILATAVGGLFFLAAVESSLAVLREYLVEAEAVLKVSLAGSAETVVTEPVSSSIPMIGQAVLGFVLPWILALVAIPLEMMLDSGRHVLSGTFVLVLRLVGDLSGAIAQGMRHVTRLLAHLYDAYIGIPLRIERMLGRRTRSAFPPLMAEETAAPEAAVSSEGTAR